MPSSKQAKEPVNRASSNGSLWVPHSISPGSTKIRKEALTDSFSLTTKTRTARFQDTCIMSKHFLTENWILNSRTSMHGSVGLSPTTLTPMKSSLGGVRCFDNSGRTISPTLTKMALHPDCKKRPPLLQHSPRPLIGTSPATGSGTWRNLWTACFFWPVHRKGIWHTFKTLDPNGTRCLEPVDTGWLGGQFWRMVVI